MDFDLRLSLFSLTPVVEYKLIPTAKLISPNNDLPDKYSFEFKWYRSKQKIPPCCKHDRRLAIQQCRICVKYGLPVEKTYHCGSKCYVNDWGSHRDRHLVVAVAQSKSRAKNLCSDLAAAADEIYHSYRHESPPDGDSMFETGSESIDIEGDESWREIGPESIDIEGDEPWSEIASSETYEPTLHDFGHRLKLQSQAVNCQGLPLTQPGVIVTDPVIIAPDPCPRQMISVGSLGSFTGSTSEIQPLHTRTFSILTYNVLVDFHNLKAHYPHCPTWALTWEYRWRNLLREIIQYNADILCLQEVQNDHYDNFFEPELSRLGYSVVYKKKSSVIYTGKESTDGCATFFRNSRFTLIETSEIEFRKKAHSALANLSQQQKNITQHYIWTKDNIAVIVKLMDKKNGTVFCVANTHILADPMAKDVKVWQVATLINELEKFCKSKIPVLVCADLNSLPRSGPHDLVVRGRVDRNHEDLTSTCVGMFDQLNLFHRMRLASAYSSILNNTNDILISKDQRDKMDPNTMEPFFTNFTTSFVGAIDYIFYSEESFIVKSLLELVDGYSVAEDIALPSRYWSSDHIALMAEFDIMLPNTRSFNAAGRSW